MTANKVTRTGRSGGLSTVWYYTELVATPFSKGGRCNSGEARGQQEGLQYSRGSSGVVESNIAQVESIGKKRWWGAMQCDKLFGDNI